MWKYLLTLKAKLRFHDYHPQPVSFISATRWIQQFEKADRKLAWQLLTNVIYLSERETKNILLHQNKTLMENLLKAGLPSKKLIYIQTDDAGSSSPMMLGMLRDAAGLIQRSCKLLDGRDGLGINHVTSKLEEGAIIYVDDFVATGDQFCKARAVRRQSVDGN